MEGLPEILDSFRSIKALVIGEAILDVYSEGSTDRLCREAPVPILAETRRREAPGGAANTAVNIRAMGAQVSFLSVVGDDAAGKALARQLKERGVDVSHLFQATGRRTLEKQRFMAGGQMLLRVDHGDTGSITTEQEQDLIEALLTVAQECQAIVVSDYGYGILTPRVIAALSVLQTTNPRVLVVDSRDLRTYRHVNMTAIKPNYEETLRLLGSNQTLEAKEKAEWVRSKGEQLLEIAGTRIAAITLDSDGALVFERGSDPYRTYAQAAPNSQCAGAGDTFVSVFALALAVGASTAAASEMASAASAVVVAKEGTAVCSRAELLRYLENQEKWIRDASQLAGAMEYERQRARRVIFTNGCFDILHSGHVAYLNQAKRLGDVLVVGVNGDHSVRRLKGSGRPINALEDRVRVLAALSCIDYIADFDEDRPNTLIEAVRPDVYVKGGDYTLEMLPEAPLVEGMGGRVEILPYVEDRSTTNIIERVRHAEAVLAAPQDGPQF